MPDIEKRLEAFVRVGHGIVIFPGGAGTAEELLYILGILLDPANAQHPFPLVLTGPEQSREYFEVEDQFIANTLGSQAQQLYQIIINDPQQVGQVMKQGLQKVRDNRKQSEDSYQFNWSLSIPVEFQRPFEPTHANMAQLNLSSNQQPQALAANLRRAFSGIVAGNVKFDSIKAIEQLGPYSLSGDPQLMEKMEVLLQRFVEQQRMKLPGTQYIPCYKIINNE